MPRTVAADLGISVGELMGRNVRYQFVLVYTVPAEVKDAAVADVSAAAADGALAVGADAGLPLHRFTLDETSSRPPGRRTRRRRQGPDRRRLARSSYRHPDVVRVRRHPGRRVREADSFHGVRLRIDAPERVVLRRCRPDGTCACRNGPNAGDLGARGVAHREGDRMGTDRSDRGDAHHLWLRPVSDPHDVTVDHRGDGVDRDVRRRSWRLPLPGSVASGFLR